MSAIQTSGLAKAFGKNMAVRGIDLDVDDEIFGFLGRNGSGKTTTVKMLTTLLRPTSGTALICGHDIVREPEKVREAISYLPQDTALDINFSGRENVNLYARFFGVANRKDKVDEIMAAMGLSDRAADRVRTYSGGMRRRLELAQAMVHEPRVLFLDEPTLGLDVAARRMIWEHVLELRKRGTTVFVTTHYMDEADRYCDRVAIIDGGKIVAAGTPGELKSRLKKEVVAVRTDRNVPDPRVEGLEFAGENVGEIIYYVVDPAEAIGKISARYAAMGVQVTGMASRKPSLDDVFVSNVAANVDSGFFDDARYVQKLKRRK